MSAKIESLRIENFRGIRQLPLVLESQSLIVVGENGSGKSSIIDALEYYFTGTVEKLTGRADVSEKRSIPHLGGGRTEVTVAFTGENQPFTIPFPRRSPKVRSALRPLFDMAKDHPFVLRRSQILNFVNARPSERYKEISKIVGLGDLDTIDSVWRRERKEAEREVARLGEAVDQIYDELSESLTSVISSERDLLNALDDWLLSASLEAVERREQLGDRVSELRAQLRSYPERVAVTQLRQLLDAIAALEEDLEQLLAEQETLSGRLIAYWQDSDVLEDASWERLLNEAQRALGEVPELSYCPLCEAPLANRDHFLAHLESRVEKLKAVTTARRQVRQTANGLAGRLNKFGAQLKELVQALQANKVTVDVQVANRAIEDFAAWRSALEGDRLTEQGGSLWRERESIQAVTSFLEEACTQTQERLTTIAWDDHIESLYELLQKLSVVDEQWHRLEVANKRLIHAQAVYEQISKVYDELIAARRRGVKRLGAALQEDFNRFYQQLHPDEGYGEISLIPRKKQGSGVDLLAQFFGQEPAHPLGYWSEGHLDSLGLCVFLAFIRRFNNQFKIVALDDVLTTVDAGHRLRVARLLAKEFSGYQFIITTHDQLWAKQLQNALPNSRLISLKPWSFEQGAGSWGKVLSDWEYYQEQAAKGRPQDAIAGTGRNLEKFLYQMRGNLRLAVPAKPNDDYTIGDLYPSFFKWVKAHQIERADRPTFGQELLALREELEEVWRLRNWAGAHFNEWAATVTTDEAIAFIETVRRLVEAFECPACRNLVIYRNSVSALTCPVCQPQPPERVAWKYDPQWYRRAQLMLKGNSPKARRNVQNMTTAIFDYFLQDMRRRVRLSIPASVDESYTTADLFGPFFRWAQDHPRGEAGQWNSALHQRYRQLRVFRQNGEWQVGNEAVPEFTAVVWRFISLFACDGCSQLLCFDEATEQYNCPTCAAQNGATPASAYWFVR